MNKNCDLKCINSIFFHFQSNSLFIIRLNDMWIFTCAGSIINKWTVISATHCFKDNHEQPIETKNLAFVVGQHEIKHALLERDPKEWNIPFHEVDEVFSPRSLFLC